MKSLKILIIVLLFSRSVSAQIVLAPKVTGTSERRSYIWYNIYSPSFRDSFSAHVAYSGNVFEGRNWRASMSCSTIMFWLYTFHGIFEFDLEHTIMGADFPPPGMTSQGWQAQLENLQVTAVFGQDLLGVDLFDLRDGSQDGTIDIQDFNPGNHLLRLTDEVPSVGTTYSVDVTSSLRHDLFGPTRFPTSGFVLKPTESVPLTRCELHWSTDARITITFDTPTPTPTITPTAPPTPTPENPCDKLKVRIHMPATFFSPGDPCSCMAVICNPGPEIYTDIPLFVILDVFGTYLFWPDFSSFDYTILGTVPEGPLIVRIIPEFEWPEGAGTVLDGVQWIAAMTDPEITSLLGSAGTWHFGWGN